MENFQSQLEQQNIHLVTFFEVFYRIESLQLETKSLISIQYILTHSKVAHFRL